MGYYVNKVSMLVKKLFLSLCKKWDCQLYERMLNVYMKRKRPNIKFMLISIST